MPTVNVTPSQVAAAQLIRELDRIEGLETDPRVEAIATAIVSPATGTAKATVRDGQAGRQTERAVDA